LTSNYLFFPGFWVNAEPAADFAALLAPGLLRVLLAELAALGEVTFCGAFVCERAEPAADFAALLAFGFCKVLDAALAAFGVVTSGFFI
jgi:hypothetical protein